jgi:hypothetical protein
LLERITDMRQGGGNPAMPGHVTEERQGVQAPPPFHGGDSDRTHAGWQVDCVSPAVTGKQSPKDQSRRLVG